MVSPLKRQTPLFEEGQKALLGGEVGLVAGDGGPEEHRHVHRVVVGRAAHRGELRPHVVAQPLELRLALGPDHNVAVTSYGAQPLRMGFVQVEVNPLLVQGVAARVVCQRVHAAGPGFEPLEGLVVVVQKEILVVDVRASEQQPRGGREREPALRAVGREPLVAEVRRDALRQEIQIRERVHREQFVANAHHARVEADVLVDRGLPLVREGEVTGQQPRIGIRADDLRLREAVDPQQPRIVQDALHLGDILQKTGHGLPVADLLRDDEAPAQHGRGTRLPQPFGGALRDEEVAGVAQKGSLVEVAFIGPGEKRALGLGIGCFITLLDEEVLLVDDGVVREDLQRLDPGGVQRLVLLGRQGEELREHHAEGGRHVCELRENAVPLDGQQREFRLEGRSFQGSSHGISVWGGFDIRAGGAHSGGG